MTDSEPQQDDPFATMKAEFQQELEKMRAENQAVIDSLKEANESLTKQNQDLQRAIVKGVFAPGPEKETPKEPTEEEKYATEVKRISDLTLSRLGVKIKE